MFNFSSSKLQDNMCCSIKKSFIAKLSIAIEEADESNFWMEFIIDEKLITNENLLSLYKESTELTAIFMASRKTAGGSN